MRLFAKAKRHGVWDPAAIDFARDRRDWGELPAAERDRLSDLCAIFLVGEETVSANVLPLLRVLAAEGRAEEALYLSSFLFEEAKHVDLFDRFFADVTEAGPPGWPASHPMHRRILVEELPAALRRLDSDPSAEAQVRAAVTYNLVVEGVLGEAGYFLFGSYLRRSGRLPGLRQAVTLLRRDESRHIAFGVHLISRLVAEHGDPAYRAFLDRMGELKPLAEGATAELFCTDDAEGVYGVTAADLAAYSRRRMTSRIDRIVGARRRRGQEGGGVSPRPEASPAST